MYKDKITRELSKIQSLAREYEGKGYRVVLEPRDIELPDFMKSLSYRPDLVVYGKNHNIIIEVKDSQTFSNVNYLSYVADLVNKQKGWEFVLVTTKEKESPSERRASGFYSTDASKSLDEAENLLRTDKLGRFVNAALLIAWAGLESSLRDSLSRVYHKERPLNTKSLIRDSTMLGIISRDDSLFIESIMKKRDSIAHGFESQPTSEEEVTEVIHIGRKVILETSQPSQT